jgi:ketosteroid isomerase-like protein
MANDDTATTAAAIYFDAWLAGDFARLRSVLADDVDFAGPLGQVTGGDECLRGLEGLTRVADPVPVANWMQVRDGKITRIRVAFDPRGIAGGS